MFFIICLCLDIAIVVYEQQTREPSNIKTFRIGVDILEILFRLFGIFFVGKFISDLHTLFESPMVQYTNTGQIIPPSPAPIIRGTLNPRYF